MVFQNGSFLVLRQSHLLFFEGFKLFLLFKEKLCLLVIGGVEPAGWMLMQYFNALVMWLLNVLRRGVQTKSMVFSSILV